MIEDLIQDKHDEFNKEVEIGLKKCRWCDNYTSNEVATCEECQDRAESEDVGI